MKAIITHEGQSVDARTQQACHDLARWIRWLASVSQIPGHWFMNAEDITAECYFVLAKVACVYAAKPYNEFIILAKTSMRNAIGSMRYKIGVTHRKHELTALSLDEPIPDSEDAEFGDFIGPNNCVNTFGDSLGRMGLDPSVYTEAAESFLDRASKLSKLDLEVLDALLGNDTRLSLQIRLMVARKNFVFSNPTLIITPHLVARALGYSVSTIEASFERIKEMLWI